MKKTFTVKNLTLTAMFMALNIVMSSFGVPVPGGHFYLNDVIICTASILLDPFSAFIVGGLGAFIGDLIFYPTPMFVSLVTHGLQAVVISLFVQKVFKGREKAGAIVGVILGAVVANIVPYGIASINGMAVAAICYLIGRKVNKNR